MTKLSAVARRGIRRAFWDLYEIVRSKCGPTLTEAAQAYLRRFGRAESDLYHVARALTCFGGAQAAWTGGLTPSKWTQIKRFFRTEAPKLLETFGEEA